MFIVLGATGHIGSELVNLLDAAGEKVIAIVHDAGKADDISTANVEPIVLDVGKTAPLHALFRRGRRAFLLNPPADPGGHTDAAETATARAITDALPGSGLEKIVVASTYGAQPGEGIGDLSVLFDFEQRAEASGVPTAINRAAYYYTNLDMLLEPAREGVLQTPFPGDMRLPMVSPIDIAKAAASRLLSKSDDVGIRYVEGPRRYTFDDVTAAFSKALGHPCAAGDHSTRQMGGELSRRGLLAGSSPCLCADDRSDGRWAAPAGRSLARRRCPARPYQKPERTIGIQACPPPQSGSPRPGTCGATAGSHKVEIGRLL